MQFQLVRAFPKNIHLGRRTQLFVHRSNATDLILVLGRLAHAIHPLFELTSCPFKVVVGAWILPPRYRDFDSKFGTIN